MKVFTLPNGSVVSTIDQFQIGNQKYPAGWLALASDTEILAAGIVVTTVADPIIPLSPFLGNLAAAQTYVTGLRKKAAQLKAKGDIHGSVDLLLKAAGVQT